MRPFCFRHVVIVAACLAPLPLPAQTPAAVPEPVLANAMQDPAWHDVLAQLGQQKSRVSHFEERRYFPFHQKPVVLQGEIRLSPEHGLSLHYFGSKAHIIVVDRSGVLLRDENGRDRPAPNDPRAQAATSALFEILRFDLPSLEKHFVIHGTRDGARWTLGFVPKDQTVAGLLGAVVVRGESGRVEQIDMIKSEKQRIEILIKNTLEDVVFPDDVVKQYFR